VALVFEIPEEPNIVVTGLLVVVLLLVLVLPFRLKIVEKNLEAFFFVMGSISAGTVGILGLLDASEMVALLKLAALSPLTVGGRPIGITQVVLIAGLLFHLLGERIYVGIQRLFLKLGPLPFAFVVVAAFGLASSIISVIVASVVLSEILLALPVGRKLKVELAVAAAFALGMGAALTPVGEPLATIAVSKLSGEPYYASFDFLARTLGHLIVPGVLVLACYAGFKLRRYYTRIGILGLEQEGGPGSPEVYPLSHAFSRAFKVYLFVFALEMLGASFTPLVYWYLSKAPSWLLYWINTVSAVLDNATLTAAEVAPVLTIEQIKSILVSLLISGGMLIPGNIPNIIMAGRLEISSKEWARVGAPLGVVLLASYFVLVEVIGL